MMLHAGLVITMAWTAGATAGQAAKLGELTPVEVVEWTGDEPFASVFADKDLPVVLRSTRCVSRA